MIEKIAARNAYGNKEQFIKISALALWIEVMKFWDPNWVCIFCMGVRQGLNKSRQKMHTNDSNELKNRLCGLKNWGKQNYFWANFQKDY